MYTLEDLTSIKNDSNGNPRYVIHYLAFIRDNESFPLGQAYNEAVYRAKKLIDGKRFHNKQYGGGIVFTSYNPQRELDKINQCRNGKE